MGAHGGQPLQCLKDLLLLPILGLIDHVGLLGQIGYPLLGKKARMMLRAKFSMASFSPG